MASRAWRSAHPNCSRSSLSPCGFGLPSTLRNCRVQDLLHPSEKSFCKNSSEGWRNNYLESIFAVLHNMQDRLLAHPCLESSRPRIAIVARFSMYGAFAKLDPDGP